MFHLVSAHGTRLAVRDGAIVQAVADAVFLAVPDGVANLNGLPASRLLAEAPASLARMWLVARADGVVGIMGDDGFLSAPADGAVRFGAARMGRDECFTLQPVAVATRKKTIWLEPVGNVGNRALQYLAAEGIRRLVPGAVVENVSLPEFPGLHRPAAPPDTDSFVRLGQMRLWLDVPGLADCLRRDVIDAVIMDGFHFRIAHYPPRAACRALLPHMDVEVDGFGADELVCSVRADEILDGRHGYYFPLPPDYYRLLAEISGLRLVFYGQLGDDPYSVALRAAFPEARFFESRGVAADFEVLRRSRNIALSLSTFAWAAAWLSEAERIFLPVAGFYSPAAENRQDFLAVDDPAFQFVLFPVAESVNIWQAPAKFFRQQAMLAAGMRVVGREEVRAIIERANLVKMPGPFVGGFDPAFYVTQDVTLDYGETPLAHYMRRGCFEQKYPVRLDDEFYLAAYPEVAVALAECRYLNALHHYVAEGWRLGYRPAPAEG